MDDISGIMEGSAFDHHHHVQFSTILSDNIHAYPPREGLARGSRSSTPVKKHHHDHRDSPFDAFDGHDFTDSIGPGHSMFSTLQDTLRSVSPPWIRNPTKQSPIRTVDGRRASPKRGSLLGPFAFMAQSIGELKGGHMQPADLITLRKQLTLLRLQMQNRIGEDRLVAEEQILTAWYLLTEKEEEAHALETRTTQFKTVYTTQRRLEEMERQVEKAYESLAPTFEKLAKFNEIKAAQRERKQFLKSPKSFKDKTKTNQDYSQKILDLERAVKHLDRINEKKGRMHKTPILASVHRLNSLTPESLKKRDSFLVGASPNGQQQQSGLGKTVSFFGDVEGDMAKPLTDVDAIFDDNKATVANTNANAGPGMPVLKAINTSNQQGNDIKAASNGGNKSPFASAKDMLKPTTSTKERSLGSASTESPHYSSAKDLLKPTTPNSANNSPNKQSGGSTGGGDSFTNVKDALKPTPRDDEKAALSPDKAAAPSPHQAAKETLKPTPARQPSKVDEGVNSTMAQPIIAMKETLRPPSVREASIASASSLTNTTGNDASADGATGDTSANGEKPTEFVRKASMFGKLVRKASGLMDGKSSGNSAGTTPQDTSGAGLFAAAAAAAPEGNGSNSAGTDNKPFANASVANNHHDDMDDLGGDIVMGNDLNDLLSMGSIPSAAKPTVASNNNSNGSAMNGSGAGAAVGKGPVEIVPLTSENLRRSSTTGFNANDTNANDANGASNNDNNNPASPMDTASNADGSDAGKKKGRNFMKGFRKRTSFMFGANGDNNKGSETGSNPDKPRPSLELPAGSGSIGGGDVMSPASQVND